ncbi:hypothetical protein DFP72DRAFT_995748 [Ephemerocybe angulata]|uniref:DUF4218 domain-containing protein n=1 Tax=Ephemerocybe angulata TaxID=980116 RepID=A0A8H6LTY7_9AGAR|nr:hypothetical protein DFP72DRAFT_995748 [Tulosesus angulatus]
MNPVFRPLVDSLLRFWQTGVYFAHTASHPHGCLVRAIIAALVCDIPGMRKVAGFAGHSANLFCSFCKLLKNQIHNLDRDSWTPRTREGHMEDALKSSKRTGVRWSELLRLPYWNPLEFAVVDSMHNLFLNNCKNHCRKVWGMDSSDILDAIVLGEVVDDIKKTTLPSWIAAPSQNIGTKKQGKLSADQWRVLCTVSLVITLVRLWGEGGEQATSRKWLDNFLALVTAIKYATKRSTTEESITIVDDHLQLYLKGLVELFSRDVLTVNHHLSLHLPAFLRRLGPVHGWWTFAFERYNRHYTTF